jgi:hypothetical protein
MTPEAIQRALKALPCDARAPVVEAGRVVEVTVGNVGALPEASAALFRAFPDLRSLVLQNAVNRVVGMRIDGEAVGRLPELARLHALRCFFGNLGDDGLAGLAASTHLRGLRELVVYNDRGVGDVGLRALAGAPWPALQTLRLYRTGVGSEGLAALAEAHLPQLAHLAVDLSPVDDAGAEALARGQLRPARLSLSRTAIGAAGAEALARAAWTGGVTSLSLAHDPLGPDGVRALAGGFAGLTELDLVQVGADDGAVAALARAAFASALRSLHLSGQPVRPAGARALAEVPFAALGALGLSRAGLDVEAVRTLAAAGVLRHLRSLSLAGTALGDAGVRAIGDVPDLERLDLGACALGDAAIASLARIDAPLQHLALPDDDIEDAGAATLAAWPALGACRTLLLAGNRIGDEGAAALAHALPHLGHLDLSRNRVSSAGQAALKSTALWASGSRVDVADNVAVPVVAAAGPSVGGVEASLVAALVRDPDEAGTAQVWLDWLIGQDDVRAGLVSAQLALAALEPGDPAAGPLEDVVEAWLRDHGEAMLAPLRALGLRDRFGPHDAVVLRHGLAVAVTFHGPVDLGAVGDALLAAAPGLTDLRAFAAVDGLLDGPVLPRLRRLSLYGNQKVEPLAASPAVQGLRELRIRTGARSAATLAASAHLGALEVLDLSFAKFGDDGARTLVGPDSRLSSLRRLELLGCALGPGAGEAFGASRLPLAHLGLRSNGLGDDGVRGLARGEHRWTTLELTANRVTPAGLEALLCSPTASALSSLTLQGNPVGDDGARVLADHAPASLRQLDLSRCGLSSDGVVRALSSPGIAGIARFSMTDTPLDPRAAAAIGALPRALHLNLSATGLDADSLAALLSADGGPLVSLSLSSASFDARGAEILAGALRLRSLRDLFLGGTPLGDAGVAALARSPHLRGLRELVVSNVGLGTEGVRAFVQRGAWGLRKLNLWKNPLGDADVQSLAAVTPDLASLDLSETAVTLDGLLALVEGPAWPHLAVLAARQVVPSGETADRRRLEAAVAAHRPLLSLSL